MLRSRVVLATGGDNLVPDHLEHLALVHVVRIEELDAGQRRAGVMHLLASGHLFCENHGHHDHKPNRVRLNDT